MVYVMQVVLLCALVRVLREVDANVELNGPYLY